MNQFLGNIEAKVDAKGRVFVPAAFRKLLQLQGEDWLVLRKDIFKIVWCYIQDRFGREKLRFYVASLISGIKQNSSFRQFVLDAERLELDGSGRILISKRYLELVEIDAHVRFLGVDNTIEVWAKDKLDNPLMEPGILLKRFRS